MELLNMMLARQLGEAPGYAPINDPKVPTDHGRMLLTLFHRIIDFLRIIKLLYTHTCLVTNLHGPGAYPGASPNCLASIIKKGASAD